MICMSVLLTQRYECREFLQQYEYDHQYGNNSHHWHNQQWNWVNQSPISIYNDDDYLVKDDTKIEPFSQESKHARIT
jgi:hypothetical protein